MTRNKPWISALRTLMVLFLFILAAAVSRAEEAKSEEKFNAGEMILEHVVDNHEWHIATIGSVHLVVPLPVILLSDGKLYTTWSSSFHNETHSWNGFKLEPEGPNQGKIVREEP